MLRNKQLHIIVLLALAALSLTSCRKEMVKNVMGIIDNSIVDEESKTFLGVNEEWIYWELNDQITIVNSSGRDNATIGEDYHRQLYANFMLNNGLENSGAAYAFYPHTMNPSLSAGTWTISIPAVQNYRASIDPSNPSFAINSDSSFGSGVLPMVSYNPDGLMEEFTFHNVCGIMRFQLFSDMANSFTIRSIVFEDKEKQLSGAFTIRDDVMTMVNNQPFLTPASADAADRKVSIVNINRPVGGAHGKLLTFYLPLPSTQDLNNPEHYPYVDYYNLRMVVKGTYNGNEKWFVKVVKVPVHKLNITKVRALKISESDLQEPEDYTMTTPTNGLVGCGTQERPYQVYTADDLLYIRDCINSSQPINGQTVNGIPTSKTVDNTTYFKIVRSDIRLIPQSEWDAMTVEERAATPSRPWSAGITNFKGIMYHASSHDTSGIINNSGVPLFVSISSQGRVEGLHVKGNITVSGSDPFSPFCTTNNGILINCHNRCSVTSSSTPLAGICVTNNGDIIGGANKANLHSSSAPVAGICYNNENGATVSGNFSISSAQLNGSDITGICYNNKSGGTISECQVSTTSDESGASSGNWGVIVFNNQAGATVNNCAASGAMVLTTTGSIGGIVNTNQGVVSNSNLNVNLRGTGGSVGGIVANMTSGEVYNCYVSDEIYITGIYNKIYANYVGGIVGKLSGGSVFNCFNACTASGGEMSGGIAGSVDLGAIIENCWTINNSRYVGDHNTERINYGTSGAFCFSDNAGDASWGCATIIKPGFTVEVPSALNDVASTIATSLTLEAYNGAHLATPLNAWVDAVNTINGNNKYCNWSTSSAFPTFVGYQSKKAKKSNVSSRRDAISISRMFADNHFF